MLKFLFLLFFRLNEEISHGEVVDGLNLEELIEAVQSSWDQTGTKFFFLITQFLLLINQQFKEAAFQINVLLTSRPSLPKTVILIARLHTVYASGIVYRYDSSLFETDCCGQSVIVDVSLQAFIFVVHYFLLSNTSFSIGECSALLLGELISCIASACCMWLVGEGFSFLPNLTMAFYVS